MKKKFAALFAVMICIFGMAGCSKPEEEVKYDLIPMVMVDGELYMDTGNTGTYVSDDTTYDKEITSTVEGFEVPTEDNQSNFGTGFKYRYGATEGTIEINMNYNCCIFATEEVKQHIQQPEKQ